MTFMASNDHYHQGEQVYCGKLVFAGINKSEWTCQGAQNLLGVSRMPGDDVIVSAT